MVSLDTLKSKFIRLQEESQRLREERIRLESEVKTLEADYQKKLSELLEATGTSSYQEAVAFCQAKREELEAETEKLDKELDYFLQQQQGVGDNVQA